MLYLCDIRTRLPADMPQGEQDRLLARERERGEALVRAGNIQAIWRIAGSLRNASVWAAGDNQELHELLRSLPLAPYQEVSVLPLADHPLTALADSVRRN